MPLFSDPLPTALYSAAQMRELDARLIAAGTPGLELMQRAARACWRALRRRWPQADEITVLTGSGNNGGDGYLLASLAQRAGWSVRVLAVSDPAGLQGDAALAHRQARDADVSIQAWQVGQPLRGVLVDALLGTGLREAPRGAFVEAIEQINASNVPVLAIDLPSGLCADSGMAPGAVVRADVTVSLIGLKLGAFTGMAAEVLGELQFDDLQADPELVAQAPFAAQRLTAHGLTRLAPRPRAAHKGQFGHVLVIGGDQGTGGASLLCAQAALRCGAGLVSLATRAANVAAAQARCPEIMAVGVDSASQVLALSRKASVLVVGPGLGQGGWGRSLLSAAAAADTTLQVWDADALNLLADEIVRLPAQVVLTPHPGEAARLLGISSAAVQADRPRAARQLAERFRACVVLKGAGTLVAAADGRLALCDRGHPAMAGAGLGDVLAGLVGALLAQRLAPFEAACLGVWLHASAGQQLGEAQGRGLAASDLIPVIRELLEAHSPCLN